VLICIPATVTPSTPRTLTPAEPSRALTVKPLLVLPSVTPPEATLKIGMFRVRNAT
jgi:hypothetical protein